MKASFGPWTTAIHDHGKAPLAAFWKRRLRALPAVGGARSMNRVAALGVVVVAAVGFGLPTFRAAAIQAENEPAPASSATAGGQDSARRTGGDAGHAAGRNDLQDEDATQAEQPALRYLSWEHEPPADDRRPIEGTYWLPSGRRVTDPQELEPLRELTGRRVRNRPGSRVLHLFVRHSQFPLFNYGEMAILNTDGSASDRSLGRAFPSQFRAEWRRGTAAHGSQPGWQLYQVDINPGVTLPEQAMLRLHYNSGSGRRVATIAADAEADREVIPGVRLRQIAEDDGRPLIAVQVDDEQAGKFHYDLTAVDAAGRTVPGVSRDNEPAGRFTRTYQQPLERIRHFELFEWRKESVEFKDVRLRPID